MSMYIFTVPKKNVIFLVLFLFTVLGILYSQNNIDGNINELNTMDNNNPVDNNMIYNSNMNQKFESTMIEDLSSINDTTTNTSNPMTDLNMNIPHDNTEAFLLQNRYIGKDISNKNLLVELQASNVIYSLDAPKYFTLTIKNTSTEIFTINLADDYVHNIFLDVYDEIHSLVKTPSSLMIKRNSQYINYRSIALYPNEFFTLEFDIDEFVEIKTAGIYKISARFFPKKYSNIVQTDLNYTNANNYIESTTILFSLVSVDNIQENIDIETSKYTDIYKNTQLVTREYNPYDVVQDALTSLKAENWDAFFMHIDIVKLFTNSVGKKSTFDLLSVNEQQKEISEYMKRLQLGNEKEDFYPPESFDITETRYTNYNATVNVTAQILQEQATQLYKYNFILEKQTNGWKIVNYTVQFLGIEKFHTKKTGFQNNTEYVSPTDFR